MRSGAKSRTVNILNVDSPRSTRTSSPQGQRQGLDESPLPQGGAKSSGSATPLARVSMSRESAQRRHSGLGSTRRQSTATKKEKFSEAAGSYKFLTEILNDVDSLLEKTNREHDPFAYYNRSKTKSLKASMAVGYHPVFQKMDDGMDALTFTVDNDKEWP
eukprot:2348451-Rhodomonas_salina.1